MLSKNLRRAKNIILFRNPIILYRLPGFTNQVERCPICGGNGVFIHKNLYTALERCESCSHVFARQQPRRHILSLLYEDDGFWELDRSHQGIHEVDFGPHWEGYLNARMGIMERTGLLDPPGQRFFEIGCSEGILLRELTQRGHYAEGCEMNPSIVRMGREKLGVTIHNCTFEELPLPAEPYDRVITFHTLEHLNDPHATLRKIVQLLTPEGSLLVEVPTGAEDFDNIYHVHFFEPESLRRLLGTYFEETEILENQFTNPDGTVVNSLYGVGRRPKAQPENERV
jgi:2-polyprenyl-3-methyl-5-hydroxy-6-metoxy-1,4-benzoquinol methylase